MPPHEARRAARIELGGVEQVKEEVRAARVGAWLDRLLQDLRFGLRMLRKSPGFAVVAILTLALGIGANTAIFSVVSALFLHPPGVSGPARVVALRARYDKLGLRDIVVSAPDFAQIRASHTIFSSAAMASNSGFNYTASVYPRRLSGAAVTWQWFQVFGAKPVLGRVFTPAEDQPNANYEVVLSYGTWQHWFGGKKNILGHTIELNERSYTVVGVMGRKFRWPDVNLWVPLGLRPQGFAAADTFDENYFAVARLQPNVSFSQASTYVRVLSQRDIQKPSFTFGKKSGWGLFIVPLTQLVYGDLSAPMEILSGAVVFILLIACANIVGLLLAKVSVRTKEIAVRAALGASRSRLLFQMMVESAVLAIAGVLVSLFVAYAGVKALASEVPQAFIAIMGFPFDNGVLSFALLLGTVSVALFGGISAWHFSRIEPAQYLRDSARTVTGSRNQQRIRSVLVAGEIALGLVLLAGTALLLRSLSDLDRINPGFAPDGVVTAVVSLPATQYGTQRKQDAFFRGVLDHLRDSPGVRRAGAGFPIPFAGNDPSASFEIEGRPVTPDSPGPHSDIRYVTPGYFTTLRIPLLRGRFFTSEDRSGAQRVAVIDSNLARQYWPDQDPIGQKIRFSLAPNAPWATIVGVVGHIRFAKLAGAEAYNGSSQSSSKGAVYYSLYQNGAPYSYLMARGTGDRALLVSSIRESVRTVDAHLAVYDVKTMNSLVQSSLGPRRFASSLLAVFAGLALALSAVGLYGLVSYSVSQRTNEIGVRIALGAKRSDVLRIILRQGLTPALAGTAVGAAAALVLSRAIKELLYGISPFDPSSFLTAAAILILVAVVACYIPARRAMSVDPITALRHE